MEEASRLVPRRSTKSPPPGFKHVARDLRGQAYITLDLHGQANVAHEPPGQARVSCEAEINDITPNVS